MSNHDNHRRDEEKRTEHGPRWERGGSDNSAVARSRKSWKNIKHRTERRTGKVTPKYSRLRHAGRLTPRPEVEVDERVGG